ncbi:MAG: PEGA domain-containing protein [Deltaproteobacteria bacterium]|nr:PEGA domain-containing protein [Deltaproteobacteria bacterium]
MGLVVVGVRAAASAAPPASDAQAAAQPKVIWLADPVILSEDVEAEQAQRLARALGRALGLIRGEQVLFGRSAVQQRTAGERSVREQIDQARILFDTGEEQYLAFNFGLAAVNLGQAADVLTGVISDLDAEKLELLYRARMLEGVAWFQSGSEGKAQQAFARLIALRPDFQPSPRDLTPEARNAYLAALGKVTGEGVGSLEVRSDPADGEVTLDGIGRGRTPITISPVLPGPHTVRLARAGHENHDQTVVMPPGGLLELDAKLAVTPALARVQRIENAARNGLPIDAVADDLQQLRRMADLDSLVLMAVSSSPHEVDQYLVTVLRVDRRTRSAAAVLCSVGSSGQAMNAVALLLDQASWPGAQWPQGSRQLDLDFNGSLLGVWPGWSWPEEGAAGDDDVLGQWWLWAGLAAGAVVLAGAAVAAGALIYLAR